MVNICRQVRIACGFTNCHVKLIRWMALRFSDVIVFLK